MRTTLITAVTLLLLFANGGPANAQETSTGTPESINVNVALVSSIRDIEVPALIKGFIESVNFEEGQTVQKGEVLAQLDMTSINGELAAAQIQLDNATLQSEDNTPVEFARARLATATQEYNTDARLVNSRSVTKQELERKRLSMIEARLQLDRANAQKLIDAGAVKIEEQSVAAVRNLVDRHSIKAEFSGSIMQVERNAGEFVQEGQTVVRLVDLREVKVAGRVKSTEINPTDVKGRPVTVTLKLAGGETRSFEGQVNTIALDFNQSEGDALDSSGDFVVNAVVRNEQLGDEWLLRPNSTVSMQIHLR